MPRPSPARRAALLLALAAALPAALGAQQKPPTHFVAPTDRSILLSAEQGMGTSESHVIWLRNTSTVTVLVTGLVLRDCENVRQSCGPQKLKLRVRPGDRAMLRRIEAKERDKGFTYRYSVSWAADSVELQALGVLAAGGDQVATQQLAAARAARDEPAVNRYDIQLDAEAVAALGERIARLVVIPDSVVVPVNAFFLAHQVRVLAVDSAGDVLGRVRAYNWRVRAEGVQVIADTVAGVHPGRSMAEFRLIPPAPPRSVFLPIVVVPAPPAPAPPSAPPRE